MMGDNKNRTGEIKRSTAGKINLNGKYPCMGNWILLLKGDTEGEVVAYDTLLGDEMRLNMDQARYLHALDGNQNPMKVPGFSREECRYYYKFFDSILMIRDSGRRMKILDIADHSIHYTLYVPRKKMNDSPILKFISNASFILFLPMIIMSIIVFINSNVTFEDTRGYGVGTVLGIIIGALLHEVMHAVVALAGGGCFTEIGISLGLPFLGAYTLIDSDPIKSRLKKAMIDIAGIEANLILASLCLLMTSYLNHTGHLSVLKTGLFYAALQNILLALINLVVSGGLDGAGVISEVLGINQRLDYWTRSTFKELFRGPVEYFGKYGLVNGGIKLAVGCVVTLMGLTIPLFWLCNFALIFMK